MHNRPHVSLALLVALLPACPAPPASNDSQVVDASPEATAPDAAPPFDALDVPVVPDAGPDVAPPDVAPPDVAAPDASAPDGSLGPTFCSLGSDVPGLSVPSGFCLREFASQPPSSAGNDGLNPRALSFGPNGDLFVASPSFGAPGGASNGHGAVLVLPDDDHDGRADAITVFASGLVVASVQGLAVGGGSLYFTTEHAVWRTPYAAGQRAEDPTQRVNLDVDQTIFSSGRWTHGLARSVGGTLYASRGEHSAVCATNPIGAVFTLGSSGGLTTVADGFRNPMYLRCHYRDEVCLASELGEDGSGPNGREKLVVIDSALRHYGYPHCYRPATPASCGNATECASPGVSQESYGFEISDTPFGIDWEREQWPAPYTGGLFVALHGQVGSYVGAGVVFVPTDPTSHVPSGAPHTQFVQGFGNPSIRNERPSDVAFAPDGRLFFSVDIGHKIYWIAPTTLRMPAH